MFKKNKILVYIVITMFSFFNKSVASYDKLFFDLNIKNNNG